MKYSLFLLALAAGAVCAQEQKTMTFKRSVAGTGPVGIEMMMGGSIKGQPYSADVATETVQVLPDGNRIVHRQKSFVARDSLGRTRNEVAVQVLGASTTGDAPLKIIMIHDAINNVTYTLDTATKTARKISTGAAGSDMLAAKVKAEGQATMMGGGQGMVSAAQRTPANAQKMESLGTRVIEGVMADGTRATETIPAGQIGNDKDIVVTNEVWTAQDLKAVVLSKRVDPRMGEMTYQLSNIQRAEPAASLFELPPGYQVVEGAPKNIMIYHNKE